MAPEAYTLAAVLTSWLGGSDVRVAERAAGAYHRHRMCGLNAA